MFGVPLEILSMLVSTLGGFFLTHKANEAERLHEERTYRADSIREARDDTNGVYVRRFIVLVMMSLLSYIVIAPSLIDANAVIVSEGWFFTTTTEVKGIVYDDTIRMIITSIIGYYFGSSSAAR